MPTPELMYVVMFVLLEATGCLPCARQEERYRSCVAKTCAGNACDFRIVSRGFHSVPRSPSQASTVTHRDGSKGPPYQLESGRRAEAGHRVPGLGVLPSEVNRNL